MPDPDDRKLRVSPWEDAPMGYPASVLPFPSLPADWSDDHLEATLHDLFVATVRATQSRIDWYDRKAARMGRLARWLRVAAIVLAGLTALAPLVGSLPLPETAGSVGTSLRQYAAPVGYIGLAIAGLLVALDNFFGYTTSWMRYRVSQADLVRRLSRFRYDWVGRLSLLDSKAGIGRAERKALVDLHRDFVDAVEATVERETQIWADGLKVSLLAFDRQTRPPSAGAQPGALEVTIGSFADLDRQSVALTADGTPVDVDDNGIGHIDRPPGPCAVKLSANRKDSGPAVAAEASVQIQPGQTARVTLVPKQPAPAVSP